VPVIESVRWREAARLGAACALAVALGWWPDAIAQPRAEEGAVAVGFLSSQSRSSRPTPGALERELARRNPLLDRSIRYDYRFADGDAARLPGLAAELVAGRPALIFCADFDAARTAASATTEIPIVFIAHVDPIEHRFLTSLQSSARNVTGVTTFRPVMVKLAEVALDAFPRARRLVALLDMEELSVQQSMEPMRRLAAARQVQLVTHDISSEGRLFRLLDELKPAPTDVWVVPASTASWQNRQALVERVGRLAIPAVYEAEIFVSAGGLISYGPTFVDVVPRVAEYVERILSGVSPASLPILQPTRLELVVNLKAAREQGISVSRQVLQRADRIVE
jgi:putative ABC transport system substrate-binding protein